MEKYLIIFYIYSFCGWFLESVGGILNVKKFVNRGFLIGPYCPVYGIGVVLITFFLQKYVNDILVLYFMSVLICGFLEYFTSYIMEKVFHARWWDYHNMKFNINGRICLETLIPFGFVGVWLVKFVNPLIFKLLASMNKTLIVIGFCVITFLFIIDVIISFSVIFKFRRNVKNVESEIKDNTDEIVQKVKEEFEDFKYKISLSLQESRVNAVYRSAKLQKRIKEYRAKLSEELEKTKEKLRKLANKFAASSEDLKKKIEVASEEWKVKQELRKKNIEDMTKLVKEKYLKKNILSNRLFKAFPELEVKSKKDKK